MRFTHLTSAGEAHMVNVAAKQPTIRTATATGIVDVSPEVLAAIRSGEVPKGDVLAVARIAGIQAIKKTPDLLPLAHVISAQGAQVEIDVTESEILISVEVTTADRTGVEMEALVGVSAVALAIVDMVKSVDRTVTIREAKIVRKTGGRSGTWVRED